MCDYSLAGVPNRLAEEGERLVACRFSTGSMGLTSDASQWRSWFRENPAVCVPPGARLLLSDIPKDLQRQLDVQATEALKCTDTGTQCVSETAARFFCSG